MKVLLFLLIPSICMCAPKFREGDIVRVTDSKAFDDYALFRNCDKVKFFKVTNFGGIYTYIIFPHSDTTNCQAGTNVDGNYLEKK